MNQQKLSIKEQKVVLQDAVLTQTQTQRIGLIQARRLPVIKTVVRIDWTKNRIK